MAGTSPNLRLIPSALKPPKKVDSILDLIGDTPLLEIQRISEGLPSTVKIFAKLEGFNPGGSVKDRPAWRMIQEGLKSGKLRAGKTILDSTSGNTGIALAMIGSVLRYRWSWCSPPT
jgi:cysteine synthase B